MFALTSEALIGVYERAETSADDKAKIKQKIYDLAKLCYDKFYGSASQGFVSNTGNPGTYWGAIDLLTVPLYGWLWHETGEQYFLDAGDEIFENWTIYGWPQIEGWGGKAFSQNYRWSFDYVRWRQLDPVTVMPPPPVAGAADELAQVKTYPNPINLTLGGTSKISGLTGNCVVEIFDGEGVKVRELKEAEQLIPNTGYVEWNGKNEAGDIVGAGVYMYVVRSPAGNRKVGKIAVLK